MPSQADKKLNFADVLQKELEDVQTRRRKMVPDVPWTPGVRADPKASEEERVRCLRREALNNNMVGLALSGGGIRSATFCLGVLQGLAELGLLRRFDYLSTVSGGGYIGSWLAAWIKREGDVENVEKQLRPNHVDQAEAMRWRGPQGQVLDDEPEPIRHLRAFSNYLAPRPGLFSADGWVLIAVYLRNLLLNQLVLLLALLGLLFGVAFVIQLFSVAAYAEDTRAWMALAQVRAAAAAPGQQVAGAGAFPLTSLVDAAVTMDDAGADSFPGAPRNCCLEGLLVVIAIALLTVACYNIFYMVPTPQDPRRAAADKAKPQNAIGRLHRWILIPLLGAAVVISLLTMYYLGPRLGPREAKFDLGEAACLMLVFAAFHSVFTIPSFFRDVQEKKWSASAWLVAGLAAGAVAGLLAYSLMIALHWATDSTMFYVPAVATFSPPLLLVIFVLTGFVQIGIVGRLMDEAQREWWSSLGGRVLIYAACWLVLFGMTMFGVYLILPAKPGGSWVAWAPSLLVWAMSVGGGLLAARSPRTGPDATSKGWGDWGVEIAARAAPPLFLVGVYVLVSLLSSGIVQGGDFPTSGDDYLSRLNCANGPDLLFRLTRYSILQSWWLTPAYLLIGALVLMGAACLLGWYVDVNLFSLQGVYANRLVRCYLGASRRKPEESGDRLAGAAMNSRDPVRSPNPITGFDPLDDLPLRALRMGEVHQNSSYQPDGKEPVYWGPMLIINTALNLVRGEELAWQERKAEAFALTARHCGSRSTGYCDAADYADHISLGQAVSISGAAVSPNQGYHSAASVTALLTLFNARLGAWLGNPLHDYWREPGPRFGLLYLLFEMIGRTDARNRYIYLSDGGHFEDLGVYELIRRRCRYIILCDGGADPQFTLEDLGNLIRKVRIDFGVRIDIDVSALRPQGDDRRVGSHVAVGKIRYGDVDRSPGQPAEDENDPEYHLKGSEGLLVYLKPGLSGDEPPDLENYAAEHPDFPNQPTLNQFFTESQFESYRVLGFHTLTSAFGDTTRPAPPTADLFSTLYYRWYPPPPDFTKTYLESNQDYVAIHQALRDDDQLARLRAEVYPEAAGSEKVLQNIRVTDPMLAAERHMTAQMLTVLENAYFGLHLERYRRHPAHNGWIEVYRRWFGSSTVWANWQVLREEFSHEFGRFIDSLSVDPHRLGKVTSPPPPFVRGRWS